jgi:hypothetical protein
MPHSLWRFNRWSHSRQQPNEVDGPSAFSKFNLATRTFTEALLENLGDERMRAEFANGIKYVRDCIPPPMDGLVSVDWRYLPASTLGGDTIGWTTITLPFTPSTSRYYLSAWPT